MKELKLYLKNIDLRKRKKINYIYNTDLCKIIKLELEIKHAEISMSGDWYITVEWYLPTSFTKFNEYEKWPIMQEIYYFKWYDCIWLMSDKYSLYITLLKDKII